MYGNSNCSYNDSSLTSKIFVIFDTVRTIFWATSISELCCGYCVKWNCRDAQEPLITIYISRLRSVETTIAYVTSRRPAVIAWWSLRLVVSVFSKSFPCLPQLDSCLYSDRTSAGNNAYDSITKAAVTVSATRKWKIRKKGPGRTAKRDIVDRRNRSEKLSETEQNEIEKVIYF